MTNPEIPNESTESKLEGTLLGRQAKLKEDLEAIAAQTNEEEHPASEIDSSFKGSLIEQVTASSEAQSQQVVGLEVGRTVINRDSGILYTVLSVGEGVRPGEPIVVMGARMDLDSPQRLRGCRVFLPQRVAHGITEFRRCRSNT